MSNVRRKMSDFLMVILAASRPAISKSFREGGSSFSSSSCVTWQQNSRSRWLPAKIIKRISQIVVFERRLPLCHWGVMIDWMAQFPTFTLKMLVMSKSTNFETFRHMGFVPDPWCFLVQIAGWSGEICITKGPWPQKKERTIHPLRLIWNLKKMMSKKTLLSKGIHFQVPSFACFMKHSEDQMSDFSYSAWSKQN